MPRTGLSAVELKAKAIDVALSRIQREGFEKVRLTDVARDLGVSHAALYVHFDDRAALLDAVTQRWLGESERELQAICDAALPAPVRIRQWFGERYRRKRERVLADPQAYRAFDAAATRRQPFVQAHLATIRGQLEALLAEAALPGDTPARQAELLLEATTAFHHPRLVAEQAEEDREALLQRLLDHLLVGLGAPSSVWAPDASR